MARTKEREVIVIKGVTLARGLNGRTRTEASSREVEIREEEAKGQTIDDPELNLLETNSSQVGQTAKEESREMTGEEEGRGETKTEMLLREAKVTEGRTVGETGETKRRMGPRESPLDKVKESRPHPPLLQTRPLRASLTTTPSRTMT